MRCFDRCIEVSLSLSIDLSALCVQRVLEILRELAFGLLRRSIRRSAAAYRRCYAQGTLCGQCANAGASLLTSSAATINPRTTIIT